MLTAAAFVFPVLYVVVVSLRPAGEGLSAGLFGGSLDLSHYETLLSGRRFPVAILNTAITSVGGALLTASACTIAAFALSRGEPTRLQRALLSAFLLLMMLPGLTNIIPLYKMASDLGLLNSYASLIIAFGGLGVPLGVWIMKGFFDAIPREIEEAAAIDGASRWQTLAQVIVPIALPAILANLLINIVYNWNNFFLPLMFTTQADRKVATVALFDYQVAYANTQNELVAAACVLIMIPPVVLFIAMRKRFMSGLAEGATKG
ncbi:MAG: carbohydrate ABC transporter permease [Microbacteriaceae bacterium]|nr:carbohydrate ABC transporter permease [Microbacteriaceae bacterium]